MQCTLTGARLLKIVNVSLDRGIFFKVFYIHRIRVVLKVRVFKLFNFISECKGALSNIHNTLLTPRVDLIGEHKTMQAVSLF